MRIAFFSNFINHHQVLVADELYALNQGNYFFVEMEKMPESFVRAGYPDFSNRPYIIQSWKDNSSNKRALEICLNADVAVFGGMGEVLEFEKKRLSLNKLSFEMTERWLKKGWKNMLSPRLLKKFFLYHLAWRNKPLYALCCSGFASSDFRRLKMFVNRCYKWGYFTKVGNAFNDHEALCHENRVKLMWCARFIGWKHPELPIKMARILKDKNYNFVIDMFGNGEKMNEMKRLSANLDVEDRIHFMGNVPNSSILDNMKNHQIFLFTSDRNEGWGAVANEAMSCKCTLVASDEIGSVPYLVTNGITGSVFKSCDVNALAEQVIWLIDHPDKRKTITDNAYSLINEMWSPKTAAKHFMQLVNDILKGADTSLKSGPCSRA